MTAIDDEITGYPRQPLGVRRNNGKWPKPVYQHCVVISARGEAASIAEWLAYHRSIGFDHAYVYGNDDSPDALLHVLAPFTIGSEPFVTLVHYRVHGAQKQMFAHFMRNFAHETEWFILLDGDEFICIPGHDDVARLHAIVPPEVDAIYLNWCSYGHSGFQTRPPGSVLEHYTHRQAGAGANTKVLIRSRRAPFSQFVAQPFWPLQHHPAGLDRSLNACNVLGDPMASYYDNFPAVADAYLDDGDRGERMLGLAYIAHFSIKSEQDFDRRVRRGTKGDHGGQASWGLLSDEQRRAHHATTNLVADTYLRDLWLSRLHRCIGHALPEPGWPLLSEGCACRQSSTLHPRSPEQDAAMLVNGRLTGTSQNHTAMEADPWWEIDLGRPCTVHEIQVFNRLDSVPERMAEFVLDGSDDRSAWAELAHRVGPDLFGGVDGRPWIWLSSAGRLTRHLRITVPHAAAYLHLDQVQIFGEPQPDAATPDERPGQR